MSLWRKFADHARASNDADTKSRQEFWRREDERKEAEKKKERAHIAYMNSLECCANCKWFNSLSYSCTKHGYKFNPYSGDKYSKDGPYGKVCSDVWKI